MSSTRGDDRYSEVCGSATSVGAHAFQITVEVGELAFGGYEAHLQSLDFAEPPVHPGLRNPICKVLNDLNQTRPLRGRHPQHRTPNTRMLVLTRRSVWSAAVAQLQLTNLKVLLELAPFLFGRLAVFLDRTCGSPLVEE